MNLFPGRLQPHLLPSTWLPLTIAVAGLSACSTRVGKGEKLFTEAFPDTNGRSCSTCHVPEDNFTLAPDHVEDLFASNPDDPLFAAIDADDPDAETLTFDHLRKGLVRVWLTLPENMDLVDAEGTVTTPEDRQIFVWRSVPSIADTAMTAPYQLDGRVATLEDQAQGAVTGHSEGGTVHESDLDKIAAFERSIFSSDRARAVSEYLADGGDPANAPDVEDELELTAAEERGREVYDAICVSCHGGANTATIVDREVHDKAFPALRADGTVFYEVPATDPPTPVLAAEPTNEFINIGSAVENFLVYLGATEHESFTKDLSFPQYRFRFYADGSRTEVVAELPPALPFPTDPEKGNPFGPTLDDDGNPITGPNFTPQFFTTDPGRAAITGNPYDFEAFDIPTLRGIGGTSPYWHNNISETVEDVVELYSDHLLSKFPTLTLPGEKETDPDGDIGPPEAMTADQKSDLVAYLKRL